MTMDTGDKTHHPPTHKSRQFSKVVWVSLVRRFYCMNLLWNVKVTGFIVESRVSTNTGRHAGIAQVNELMSCHKDPTDGWCHSSFSEEILTTFNRQVHIDTFCCCVHESLVIHGPHKSFRQHVLVRQCKHKWHFFKWQWCVIPTRIQNVVGY